jgi:hypothetical protein
MDPAFGADLIFLAINFLQQTIHWRSWPMTRKQYRTPNVSSIAAMASRWFLRNVSHRFTGSGSFGARRIYRETLRSEIETQFQQFAVNARRGGLFADTLPSSCLSNSGDPCPIQTKSSPMPVHDGYRSDQDERLPPPGPERSQRNPEQFVHGSQSTARTLRVECHQLPTESQVFEDEVLAGTEGPEHPAEEMPGRRDHSQNLIGKVRIELFAKAFILQAYDVLARHRSDTTCRH